MRIFFSLSVNILPVADFHDTHDQNIILDFVEDPVDSTSKSVLLRSGKFSRLWRMWIIGKSINSFYDSFDILLRDWV